MVWNHLAAVLLLSGPLFYVGVWLAIDPGVIARSRRQRTVIRLAGVLLLLFAIAL